MRLTWPSPKQLKTVEIVEYAWECPPAICLELDDYKQEHGPDDDKWKQHMLQARDYRSLLFVSFDPSCVFARVTACLPIRQAGEDAIISTEVLEEVVTITLLRRLCKDAITHVQQFAERGTLLTCHM